MSPITLGQSAPREEQLTREDVIAQIRNCQQDPAVSQYHALWYHAKHTWPLTRYQGVPMLKAPNDLQIYHEILWQTRPTLVIETGSCFGASAMWFADQIAPWGGRVISIDLVPPADVAARMGQQQQWPVVERPNLTFLTGSSLDPGIVAAVAEDAEVADRVLVSLDSNHSVAHVRAELDAYGHLAKPAGAYLVVEDTNMSGRPMRATDPGPGAAVDDWLTTCEDFAINPLCERYLLTFHPGGWLYRVR